MEENKKKEFSIFISLPFTGFEDTLGERFQNAVKFLDKYQDEHPDIKVLPYAQSNINDLIEDKHSVPDELYPYYMGKDIQKVMECDAILMCKNWKVSKGCNLEHTAAEIYKKTIIFED